MRPGRAVLARLGCGGFRPNDFCAPEPAAPLQFKRQAPRNAHQLLSIIAIIDHHPERSVVGEHTVHFIENICQAADVPFRRAFLAYLIAVTIITLPPVGGRG